MIEVAERLLVEHSDDELNSKNILQSYSRGSHVCTTLTQSNVSIETDILLKYENQSDFPLKLSDFNFNPDDYLLVDFLLSNASLPVVLPIPSKSNRFATPAASKKYSRAVIDQLETALRTHRKIPKSTIRKLHQTPRMATPIMTPRITTRSMAKTKSVNTKSVLNCTDSSTKNLNKKHIMKSIATNLKHLMNSEYLRRDCTNSNGIQPSHQEDVHTLKSTLRKRKRCNMIEFDNNPQNVFEQMNEPKSFDKEAVSAVTDTSHRSKRIHARQRLSNSEIPTKKRKKSLIEETIIPISTTDDVLPTTIQTSKQQQASKTFVTPARLNRTRKLLAKRTPLYTKSPDDDSPAENDKRLRLSGRKEPHRCRKEIESENSDLQPLPSVKTYNSKKYDVVLRSSECVPDNDVSLSSNSLKEFLNIQETATDLSSNPKITPANKSNSSLFVQNGASILSATISSFSSSIPHSISKPIVNICSSIIQSFLPRKEPHTGTLITKKVEIPALLKAKKAKVLQEKREEQRKEDRHKRFKKHEIERKKLRKREMAEWRSKRLKRVRQQQPLSSKNPVQTSVIAAPHNDATRANNAANITQAVNSRHQLAKTPQKALEDMETKRHEQKDFAAKRNHNNTGKRNINKDTSSIHPPKNDQFAVPHPPNIHVPSHMTGSKSQAITKQIISTDQKYKKLLKKQRTTTKPRFARKLRTSRSSDGKNHGNPILDTKEKVSTNQLNYTPKSSHPKHVAGFADSVLPQTVSLAQFDGGWIGAHSADQWISASSQNESPMDISSTPSNISCVAPPKLSMIPGGFASSFSNSLFPQNSITPLLAGAVSSNENISNNFTGQNFSKLNKTHLGGSMFSRRNDDRTSGTGASGSFHPTKISAEQSSKNTTPRSLNFDEEPLGQPISKNFSPESDPGYEISDYHDTDEDDEESEDEISEEKFPRWAKASALKTAIFRQHLDPKDPDELFSQIINPSIDLNDIFKEIAPEKKFKKRRGRSGDWTNEL